MLPEKAIRLVLRRDPDLIKTLRAIKTMEILKMMKVIKMIETFRKLRMLMIDYTHLM
jgi:hypothetical protein